jgi:alcohol dehydrogenase (cytochrome c)
MRMAKLLLGCCAAILAVSGGTAWAQVTPERLLAAGTEAEAGNWLMSHKTFDSNRFSTLNEINASNVAGLRVITAAPIGGTEPGGFGVGAVETTPLADNGFLYISGMRHRR